MKSKPQEAQKNIMDDSLIFDVGMNNGDDTAYYLYLGYRVVAIDADPVQIERAKLRFATELQQGRLTLVNVGIAEGNSTKQFWITDGNDVLSSFDKDLATRYGFSARPIEVQCCPFREILEQFGVPFYLKIDIEGHDQLCLADLHADQAPWYLSLEINHGLNEFIALDRLGYDRFKIVLQNPHQAILPPQPPPPPPSKFQVWLKAKLNRNKNRWKRRLRWTGLVHECPPESKPVEPAWTFNFGSSGPFGEYAAGPWLTRNEALAAFVEYRRDFSGDLWCDIHARHERLCKPSAKLPLGAAPTIQRAA